MVKVTCVQPDMVQGVVGLVSNWSRMLKPWSTAAQCLRDWCF